MKIVFLVIIIKFIVADMAYFNRMTNVLHVHRSRAAEFGFKTGTNSDTGNVPVLKQWEKYRQKQIRRCLLQQHFHVIPVQKFPEMLSKIISMNLRNKNLN